MAGSHIGKSVNVIHFFHCQRFCRRILYHKKLIPISALLGAIFLLWSDVLCRVVLPGKEIPIGVLTALVGAPVFIYLMARKKYGFGGGD